MTVHQTAWAISYRFDRDDRRLLGQFCWDAEEEDGPRFSVTGIALFPTRTVARAAQKTCCYKSTRVERVRVMVLVSLDYQREMKR